MKVSIVIPMQQHSYETAIGLIRAGLLDKYYTTVYYKPHSSLYKILNQLLPMALVKRMQGRNLSELTPYVQTYSEFLGLILLFINRIPFLKKIEPFISNRLFSSFAKSVAKDCKSRGVEFIWTFDSWSYDIFRAFEKDGIKVVKILDMASTATPVIQHIIDEEYQKKQPFYETYLQKRCMYSTANIRKYVEEFKYADYFLSPSDWVEKSLLSSGISKEKILYLPHGVDVRKFCPKANDYSPSATLKFLFVGRVEGAKGIYYLFEAFKQLSHLNIELQVVGNTYSWSEQVENYSPNIKVMGLLRFDEMPKVYEAADVFILSSLWEGSALSMLEAMSAGLPVIASSHSCAPDIISEGVEGFVYEPYDVAHLKKLIVWYVDNKDKIAVMGRAARQKAESMTWEQYYENVANIIYTIQSFCLNEK